MKSARSSDDEGATAVEYGIMLAAVALAVVATAYTIGPKVAAIFQDVIDGL